MAEQKSSVGAVEESARSTTASTLTRAGLGAGLAAGSGGKAGGVGGLYTKAASSRVELIGSTRLLMVQSGCLVAGRDSSARRGDTTAVPSSNSTSLSFFSPFTCLGVSESAKLLFTCLGKCKIVIHLSRQV